MIDSTVSAFSLFFLWTISLITFREGREKIEKEIVGLEEKQ